jgi:hypothetical protein
VEPGRGLLSFAHVGHSVVGVDILDDWRSMLRSGAHHWLHLENRHRVFEYHRCPRRRNHLDHLLRHNGSDWGLLRVFIDVHIAGGSLISNFLLGLLDSLSNIGEVAAGCFLRVAILGFHCLDL